ncbi:MAG: glycosyltransferase [Anaerolineae bacterium]|nr:glycosyltransferase [Anaerolineae bacterium]
MESEIQYLAARFERIIIVPDLVDGEARLIPDGVEVDVSFAHGKAKGLKRAFQTMISCFTNTLFYRELWKRPVTLVQPKALLRLGIYIANRLSRLQWIQTHIPALQISMAQTIWYSSWFVPQSLGMVAAKTKYQQMKIVSRAHRVDLYHEAHTPPYIPLWDEAAKSLDFIFPVSDHGRDYIIKHYPEAVKRCNVARVGVFNSGYDGFPSDDGIFRLVSCSYMVPVKRLDLLIESLAIFARQNPSLQLEWYHLGDGPLRQTLEELARTRLPDNAHANFYGQIANQDVLNFYRTHPIDGFIQVSASEGIPASIMEAQSYSIPVIATAVGGVSEIVNNDNGILLSENPSPEVIANAFTELALNPTLRKAKREKSKHTWETLYNADQNYAAFADRLIALLD